MAEFQRVPLTRPRSRNWLSRIALAFAAFIVVMIAKPWIEPLAVGPGDSPRRTQAAGPAQSEPPSRPEYDPRLFGGREPDPGWELWPAGYVVQFGLAGPVPVQRDDASARPSPDSTGPPRPSAPSPSPGEQASRPPLGVHVVDLGTTDHLVALGINTPSDLRASGIRLWLLGEGRPAVHVPTVHLPTPWESTHFIVIAPEDPTQPGEAGPWVPGIYRLDIALVSGEFREILIRIGSPAA